MRRIAHIVILVCVVLIAVASAHAQAAAPPAQAPNDVGYVLNQYQQTSQGWSAAMDKYAKRLFGLLAALEFAWAMFILSRENDLGGYLLGLTRRVLWIGFFWALLLNGQTWIPGIVNSFVNIGTTVGNVPQGVSPGDIMAQGLKIVANVLTPAGSNWTLLTNIGGTLVTVLSAFTVVVSYCILVFQYVVTKVESFVVLGAGYIFLGFGGSRWTAPYTERYISLAVNTGVRLMIIYLLIGLANTFSNRWIADTATLTVSPGGALKLLGILSGMIVFVAVCWMVPKIVGSVMSGSLGLGASDIMGTAMAGVGAAATAAAAVATGGAALGLTGGAAAIAGGTTRAATSTAGTVSNGVQGASGKGSGGSPPAPPSGGGPKTPPPSPPASPGRSPSPSTTPSSPAPVTARNGTMPNAPAGEAEAAKNGASPVSEAPSTAAVPAATLQSASPVSSPASVVSSGGPVIQPTIAQAVSSPTAMTTPASMPQQITSAPSELGGGSSNAASPNAAATSSRTGAVPPPTAKPADAQTAAPGVPGAPQSATPNPILTQPAAQAAPDTTGNSGGASKNESWAQRQRSMAQNIRSARDTMYRIRPPHDGAGHHATPQLHIGQGE